MEVNARLQVEHPVTEAVTGLDLVKLQLHVAAGGTLEGEPPAPVGHAIEARLNAEDPAMGFAPTPGRVQVLDLASGPGVRIDRGIAAGDVIPPDFDRMVAKVIAYGRTRDEAIARLKRALRESTVIVEDGTTNRAFLLAILERPEFAAGEVDIAWLDRLGVSGEMEATHDADAALLQAAIELADDETATERASFYAFARRGRPEAGAQVSRAVEVRHRGQAYRIVVAQLAPGRYRADVDGTAVEAAVERLSGHERRITIGGETHRTMISRQGADLLVEVHGVPHRITRDDGGFVRSHGPSVVVAIPVNEGDEVAEGDVVAVVESMKMETSLTAPFAGRVRRVLTGTNVQVPAHTPLLQLEAIEDEAAEQTAERVEFSGEPLEAGDPCAAALDRLRWMLLGYDVSGDEVRRALAAVQRGRAPRRAARRRAPPARRLHRRARAQPRAPRRPRARAAAQPAGVPARVPALARREGRAAARALRQPAPARALALRRREPRPHARARGGLLPAVRLPGARRPRARRRDGDPRRAASSAPTSSSAAAATTSAACSTAWSSPPSAATR